MSNSKRLMVRQGDVLLRRVDKPAGELQDVPPDPRGLVLAEGETSGHFHSVFGPHVRLCRYKANQGLVVKVEKESAEIRVIGGGIEGKDRHEPISLPPGTYEVLIQRSWNSEHASRQVAD